MRHDHPRGRPQEANRWDHGLGAYHWCRACVTQGITTQQESEYEPRSRGQYRVGMTVGWQQFMGQDGKGNHLWEDMVGQVWASATEWSSIIEWWVVTDDGKVWKVRQDSMKIIDKEIASVRPVS